MTTTIKLEDAKIVVMYSVLNHYGVVLSLEQTPELAWLRGYDVYDAKPKSDEDKDFDADYEPVDGNWSAAAKILKKNGHKLRKVYAFYTSDVIEHSEYTD